MTPLHVAWWFPSHVTDGPDRGPSRGLLSSLPVVLQATAPWLLLSVATVEYTNAPIRLDLTAAETALQFSTGRQTLEECAADMSALRRSRQPPLAALYKHASS